MEKGYSKYSSKELLEDDNFIQAMISSTPQEEELWESLVQDGLLDRGEYETARNFVKMMKRPHKIMSLKERNELWVEIEVENKKNLRRSIRRKQLYLWGVAASLIVALSGVAMWLVSETEGTVDYHQVMADMPQTADEAKDIQIVLGDKKTIELEEKSADIELNKAGELLVNSKQVNQTAPTPPARKSKKAEPVKFNQLIVPPGKLSKLTLPDGTMMHVNAGSKVIFPNKFAEDAREIFVDGEVYLEVARNEKTPFYVRTAKLTVEVLGTVFNVKAYEQDSDQSVVLVSGSVVVHTADNRKAQLSPNQALNYVDGKYRIGRVNAEDVVSWIDGYFIYRKEKLNNIFKQMARYYGVNIVCEPADAPAFTCSGKLDLKEDINKVMQDLSDILEFEVEKNANNYHVKLIK